MCGRVCRRLTPCGRCAQVAKYLGVGVLGHTHPHDAIFLSNGDIAVAVWKGHEAGSFGGIEYWSRLPQAQE